MNELQIFNYNGSQVRTVEKNGQTFWVLKDVCSILGYTNPTMILERLEDDEVTKSDLGGRVGVTNIINESGLYNVILRSDKPEAKPFRKWVTSEVLPSIRKTGKYSMSSAYEDTDFEREYEYYNKKYKGTTVLTVNDIAYLTEKKKNAIYWVIYKYKHLFINNKDIIVLRGAELRRFKGENPLVAHNGPTATLITESGFKKIAKILGCDDGTLLLEDKNPEYSQEKIEQIVTTLTELKSIQNNCNSFELGGNIDYTLNEAITSCVDLLNLSIKKI